MNASEAMAALERAAEISRELAVLADAGDARLAPRLDAERLGLLRSVRRAAQPLGEIERRLLREIAELNDKALGLMEHRRRLAARDMDMLAAGKRAVRAYASSGRYR